MCVIMYLEAKNIICLNLIWMLSLVILIIIIGLYDRPKFKDYTYSDASYK